MATKREPVPPIAQHYSLTSIARRLDVSRDLLKSQIEGGHLRGILIGGCKRVAERDLLEWAERVGIVVERRAS